MQAWLVPHDPESAASTGCGLGTIAAVHSGFSTSWQSGLKEAVCGILHKAVKHSCQDASKMRLLVTGAAQHLNFNLYSMTELALCVYIPSLIA